MTKKAFFSERSAREIQDLRVAQAYSNRNLVEKIDDLDNSQDALEIRTPIIPGRFFRIGAERLTGTEASRKCFKHGDFVRLSHPLTKEECNSCPDIPLKIRARDFAKSLESIKQEENHYVGYSFQPAWNDRMKRVVPFVWLPEAERLFAYAESMTAGIKVESYEDAKKVRNEGASVVVEVPSRTKKHPRYKFKLAHVPMIRANENLASVLTLKPYLTQNQETGELIIGRTPHDKYNIRYNWEDEREASNVINFYPHDIAAYFAVIKQEAAKHNLTPLEMNPFALFSKHGAEFYKKLCNNVVIYDPTLSGKDSNKDKLRKLHLAEKSILLSRGIGVFGHDDFAFWDGQRDGRIKDYDWSRGK